MANWHGDLRPRGLRPRRESFWGSSSGTMLAALILVALSWLGLHFYMEHQKRLEVEAQLAAEEQAKAQAEAEEQARIAAVREVQQRELREDNRQMLEAQAYSATHNYGHDSAGAYGGSGQPATRRRSVQEEYELASNIMESTSNEYRQQSNIANSGVTSNGLRVDQSAMNQSMLAMYEQHCLWLGKGSINYRHCRADFKQAVMNQCQQVPTSNQNAEQEAQCYAARNYRIVE